MKYTCINIQGNLISEEILQKIEQGNADGQLAKDFGLEPGTNLRSEIEYAWSRIKLDWKHFSDRTHNLPANDPYGTTLSRKWMNNFLSSLNFELTAQKSNLQGDNNQSYNISHSAEGLDGLPVHIVGFYEPSNPEKNTLDVKSSGGTSRMSPHGTMQEFLNVTEHLYGIATNGITLRLIRDSGRLVKLTYVEFDLKRMLEEDKYSEFTLLYRLLQSTRFPRSKQEADQCLLEKYYQDSIETGNRIRDGLSRAVKESLLALGQGFLQHENNVELREKLQANKLSAKGFYRQLLRLIYRFLFLMVTEERDLVYDPDDRNEETLHKKRIYLQFYSIARLRKLSQNRYVYEAQFSDLWQGLVQTFQLFEEGGRGKKLGIEPLAGDLFHENAIRNLENCLISNQLLLECIRNLNEFTDENRNLVPINYRSLDVEELGSVYEGLLELHPVIENLEATNAAQINFTFHEGTDRKTTGSYYTRPDLVHELIKSALIPVIEERLKEHAGNRDAQTTALLKLKVCDAAAGSGHMLLAAARTIAWYLARVQSGEENPAPAVFRACLREVIQHCIYGVDMNPDAVELCKLALWLESHNSGKPLSFLDHKIRNGNSLVGVTDLSVLQKGIPNDAFNAVTGDDKEVCKLLKKENQAFLKYLDSSINIGFQKSLEFETKSESRGFSTDYHELEDIKQDSIDAVKKVKQKFEKLRSNTNWYKEWTACNLWTSAFFFSYTKENKHAAPSSEKLQSYLNNPEQDHEPMVSKAIAMAIENKFFHWVLEFPDVFEQGGFDVMLGNPPWEKIRLEQQQYFATRDNTIAKAKNKDERTKLIKHLPLNNANLWIEYQSEIHESESESKFIRCSNRYPLSAIGDINTYLLFTEHTYKLKRKDGSVGLIIPVGLVSENSSKVLFDELMSKEQLKTFYGFVNTKKIFHSIKDYIKFGLLTISNCKTPVFCFWLTDVIDINDKIRRFSITKAEIELISPNTKTCPIFRTFRDAEITKKIYTSFKILEDETKGDSYWKPRFLRMFDMATDSHLFKDIDSPNSIPLYEAKMLWLYDHRFSTYENATASNINEGNLPQFTNAMHADAHKKAQTRYSIDKDKITERVGSWSYDWFLAFRGIAATNNERTFIFSFIPKVAIGHSGPVILFDNSKSALELILLTADFNSLCFDFIGRLKAAGSNVSFYILKQLPVILPDAIDSKLRNAIIVKVIELVFSSWDIKAFADDVWREADADLKAAIQNQWQANQAATGGHTWSPPEWAEQPAPNQPGYTGCPLPPFKWHEERRAVLKAELDAIYAKLYGLTTEELRYILDPQDVYGADFPGETFRVLKEKEIRLYGEYRTKRLVLEAWGKLTGDVNVINTEVSISKPNSIDLKNIPDTMKEFSLHEGIYSVRDVVNITQLNSDKIRRWFKELSKAKYEGLNSKNQTDVDKWRISFHGLIELVVIGTLRENDVTLRKILEARTALSAITKKMYPFATNNVKDNLHVAGRSLTFKLPTGEVTLDGTGQFNLEIIKAFFKHIEFDLDGVAQKLFPLKNSTLIVIDPKQAGGKAVINKKGVWAEIIAMSYTGPDSIPMIREQYDLEEAEVLAAIEYRNN